MGVKSSNSVVSPSGTLLGKTICGYYVYLKLLGVVFAEELYFLICFSKNEFLIFFIFVISAAPSRHIADNNALRGRAFEFTHHNGHVVLYSCGEFIDF